MDKNFEDLIKKLSPTLRRITYKLNGHFSFIDHDDLFQEALGHLWFAFKDGKLKDKTDSYVLQGCYFHLKNYLRKMLDKVNITSLNALIDDGDIALEEILVDRKTLAPGVSDSVKAIIETAKRNGLTEREAKILALCLDGYTTREVGIMIGISHVMVVKIKKKLRKKCDILRMESGSGYQS